MIDAVDSEFRASMTDQVKRADGGTTRPAMIRLGIASRALEGFAAILPLALWVGVISTVLPGNQTRTFTGPIAMPLLLEMAVGIFLQQHLVNYPFGPRKRHRTDADAPDDSSIDEAVRRHQKVWLFATLCIAVGALTVPLAHYVAVFGIGLLVFGVGIVGRWSAAGELMKASLSNTDRWHGMHRLNLSFFIAAAIAGIVSCVLPGWDADLKWPGDSLSPAMDIEDPAAEAAAQTKEEKYEFGALLAMGVIGIAALLLAGRISRLRGELPRTIVSGLLKQGLAPVASSSDSCAASAGNGTHETTDCEEQSCCGTKVVRPMPFWLGCCIAATGNLVLWGVLFESLFRCTLTTSPLVCR
ncbi:MAG: hypothetical protein R3C19_23835 [Planctomycetaceae bacterium]